VELHIKLSQMGERYETDSLGWLVGQNPDAKGEPSQYRTAPENNSKLPHRQIQVLDTGAQESLMS
jgi:hypothetical protein